MEVFTLHIRLLKSCNADCSYCSAWQASFDDRMTPQDIKRSLVFIYEKWQEVGIHPEHLTIEYVGGEVLTYPEKDLEEVVLSTRRFFSEKGIKVRDGAQTNLIGSKRKISNLFNTFYGRIGTSIDQTSDKRTIKGSSDKYDAVFKKGDQYLKESHAYVAPAVFTMDKDTVSGTMGELKDANQKLRHLTIRPVFKGGITDVDFIEPYHLGCVMVDTFNAWFMTMRIALEPHLMLLRKYIALIENEKDSKNLSDICPFQSNCAHRSMSLEPNGDLFVCQEMADSSILRIGNAITNEWIQKNWDIVSGRADNLDEKCQRCEFLKICQGGCMMQSVQDGSGPWGRPDYCLSWEMFFHNMKKQINEGSYSIDQIKRWIKLISGE